MCSSQSQTSASGMESGQRTFSKLSANIQRQKLEFYHFYSLRLIVPDRNSNDLKQLGLLLVKQEIHSTSQALLGAGYTIHTCLVNEAKLRKTGSKTDCKINKVKADREGKSTLTRDLDIPTRKTKG